MTNEKARDFFSAYYEDSLESGLRVSFEQKLKADTDLKDEYDAFVRAMDSLDVLKFEDITIPDDLHERISARLDRNIYEKKRTAAPAWTTWLRGLAFAGVGAIAIAGAIVTLNSNRSTGPAGANLGIPGATKDRVSYVVGNDGVTLKFAPNAPKTVIVTNSQNKEIHRYGAGDTANPELKTLLSNSLSNAFVFGIQIAGEPGITYVVVPGSVRSTVNHGEGTVVDLAKALSDFYKLPVRVDTATPNARTEWTFSSSDPVGESSKALGSAYSVTLLNDGMLEIK